MESGNFDTFHQNFHKKMDPEGLDEKDLRKTYMVIQGELASEFYGVFDLSSDLIVKWIDLYAAKFAEVATEHPEFVQEYLHGDSRKALHYFAENMYEKHEVEK